LAELCSVSVWLHDHIDAIEAPPALKGNLRAVHVHDEQIATVHGRSPARLERPMNRELPAALRRVDRQ
jgi:hypothetical protein